MAHEYTLHTPPSHRPASHQIDYAKELNAEQYAAVTATPGPLLIIAGAGSGKTRTLTYRVAYLIENGVEPENILLATFTNKAAKEMLHRVGDLLPHDISRMWGGTFHHIANRLLRRHANLLGFGLDFTIMDRDDSKELLNACYGDAGIDPKDKEFPKGDVVLEAFGMAANTRKSLAASLEAHQPWLVERYDALASLQRLFKERKEAANVMDYDDLLVLCLHLFQLRPELRERYQQHFHHLLVDEYQDTNKLQADLIDLLADGHKQVMAVGDDAQSIYAWRGANFQNIFSFPERYPGTRTICIETNYRSTPAILNLANAAIAGNVNQFKKNLRSSRPEEGVKPALVCLGDANQQSQFICQRIVELHEEGIELREIAVLYRAHFHAMELQMELTRRNIPFQITSGIRFFEQAHVKDVCAYIKLALNPKDEISFKRIARMLPGLGDKTAEKLWYKFASGTPLAAIAPPAKAVEAWKQWAATHEQLLAPELENRTSDMIKLVIEAVYEDYMKVQFPNFEARLEDLSQLRAFSEQFESTSEFLAQLTLLTNVDDEASKNRRRDDFNGDAIRLSTVHQAKGLEWKAVFVMMLCDGLFPSSRACESPEGEEEERRLFYVAVTRAKDELYLSYPVVRASAGYRDAWQSPSRFLLELPRELVNEWKITRQSGF
ncbi:DNA helicase-2 / ATP-dependent DNA helicase PcrA [Verrucomicrobium sp. GAS474]|uniref:ATP-dependent helicase n=1 Tax=Verrucomicrobium sp. GAS474 TaxID=1882831 RepID=UPI00087A88D0|nr:ATP-dependent helicase [Verrucomicrobium sp. GAS474]SDU15419.1 DNA helicase-2 / ATP-dependent DNA helicase PcrA [Verrucomicrobium sp. GAS474]